MSLTLTDNLISRRIDALIESGHTRASALLDRLQKDRIDDAAVPIGPEANGKRPEVLFDGKRVGIATGDRQLEFHPHAARQFGSKLGIASGWLSECLEDKPWHRALIADVMSTTLSHTETKERLLRRSVGNEVRGVLSDQYRRLDSPLIASGFAAACQRLGALPYRAQATDISWSVSAMLPQPIEVELPFHGVEVVAACVHLHSSDYGAGPLELSFEILRVLCTYGLIGKSALRQVHLGRRLPEELKLSEKTYRLDSETQASTVLEITERLLDEKTVTKEIAKLKEAFAREVDPEPEIEGLVRARRITKSEAEDLERVLLRADPREVPPGPATRWKLAQTISWGAKAQGERQSELERLAGAMVLQRDSFPPATINEEAPERHRAGGASGIPIPGLFFGVICQQEMNDGKNTATRSSALRMVRLAARPCVAREQATPRSGRKTPDIDDEKATAPRSDRCARRTRLYYCWAWND